MFLCVCVVVFCGDNWTTALCHPCASYVTDAVNSSNKYVQANLRAVGVLVAYATGEFSARALLPQDFKVPLPHDTFGPEAIALEAASTPSLTACALTFCLSPY